MLIEDNTQDLFKLSLVWLKENNPKFEVYKRGNWATPVNTVKWVAWTFEWVSLKTFTYMKNWVEETWTNVNINLSDWKINYVIQSWFNSLIRTTLNCLLNINKGDNISITPYPWKNDFPWIAVRQWEELVKWKMSWDAQKAMIEAVEFKGKKMNDYTKLEEHLIENSIKYVREEKPQVKEEDNFDFMDEPTAEETKKPEENKDDLPF